MNRIASLCRQPTGHHRRHPTFGMQFKTLRTHVVEDKPAPEATEDELQVLRECLRFSRAVFARYLRIKPRMLENWEQRRVKPNTHTALLIRHVEKYPDTVERLAAV